MYPNQTPQKIAKDVLYASTAARFDGSDLMPAAVGAGTFWTQSIEWVTGQKTLDQALNAIDTSFPKSAGS